jgi:hypothetical protein
VTSTLVGSYRVNVGFDPIAKAGGWIGLLPDGSQTPARWCSLREIALREFLARLWRVMRRAPASARQAAPPAGRQQRDALDRVADWAERAGAEWARKHAWKHYRWVLADADIAIDYLLVDLARHRPPKAELYVDRDLLD